MLPVEAQNNIEGRVVFRILSQNQKCSLYLQHLFRQFLLLYTRDMKVTFRSSVKAFWIIIKIIRPDFFCSPATERNVTAHAFKINTDHQKKTAAVISQDRICRSSLWLLVLSHVRCDRVGDLHASFVLSEILHEFSVRSHKVHDDGVINLKATRGGVQTSLSLTRHRKTEQVVTHNVVVVFVFRTLTVINPVGSGNLLNLSRRSRQANQLRGKLWTISEASVRLNTAHLRFN